MQPQTVHGFSNMTSTLQTLFSDPLKIEILDDPPHLPHPYTLSLIQAKSLDPPGGEIKVMCIHSI